MRARKEPAPAVRPMPMQAPTEIVWRFRAACRGEDAALFFAPSYFEKKEEKDAREALAKRICARCEVREECLDHALRTQETHGIWGGLNEMERRVLMRMRERAAG